MPRRFIPVVLLFLAIIFALIMVGGEESSLSFAFRIYFLPVVLAAYLGGKKGGYITASVAIVHGIMMTFTSEYILPNILFLLLSSGIFFFAIKITVGFDERLRRVSSSCNEKSESAKTSYDGLIAEDEKLLKNNRELEKRGVRLAELYEASKAMGASLDFGKILEIVREAVRETFDFSRGVLLLQRGKGSKKFDFQYRFDSGEITEGDIESGRNEVINWIMKTAKPLIIQEDAERRKFNLPSQVSSVLGVPLILSDRVIGVCILENFALRGVESREATGGGQVSGEEITGIFSILTTQFALQMQKVALYEEVEKLSITDGLTQVALRRYFLRRFEEELKRARHYGLSLSFLMADIDNFKSYNDRYGHLVGDAVLREIAKILREGVREVDFVGRYGGEEFCAMLPETDKKGAYEVAERIRWLVGNSHFKAYDEKTSVTISVGVSSFPVDADTGEKLMNKADAALLRAKESGRNRVCKYE